MFGKEAEEILNNHCDCELLSECMTGIRCRCSDFEEEKKLLLEGIKFGYNKANEWHYVKDGNPDNENDILCQIAKDEVVVGYYHTVEKRYITIEGQDLYNVIAWKQIVLPELKESEL